ncbi:MAG: glycine cleavage system protein H [Aureliella sp.]
MQEHVFMMGEYEARFPVEFYYAKNHMWAQSLGGDCWRFGLSGYAVRLLQDVYFLDLTIESEMQLAARQEIGSIESKKAESSLYSPIAGTVTNLNDDLLQDPTAINVDKYGKGWMFELDGPGDQLLKIDEYLEHLNKAWEIAQRTIKGQANA